MNDAQKIAEGKLLGLGYKPFDQAQFDYEWPYYYRKGETIVRVDENGKATPLPRIERTKP